MPLPSIGHASSHAQVSNIVPRQGGLAANAAAKPAAATPHIASLGSAATIKFSGAPKAPAPRASGAKPQTGGGQLRPTASAPASHSPVTPRR